MNMKNNRPLKNKTIVITRPMESAASLTMKIEEQGGTVLLFPTVSIVPTGNWSECDHAIRTLEQFDWIIFSSHTSARYFLQRLAIANMALQKQKIGAIGEKTAHYLNQHGIPVALMPEKYSAAGFLAGFKNTGIEKASVLLPLSAIARDELALGLEEMGHRVTTVEVYRTITNPAPATEPLMTRLAEETIHCITFYSPSAVTAFFEIMDGQRQDLAKIRLIPLAVIGKTTAAALQAKNFYASILPKKSSDAEMAKAICAYFIEHKDD
jgi:uroporphyrinogen-III synthase